MAYVIHMGIMNIYAHNLSITVLAVYILLNILCK